MGRSVAQFFLKDIAPDWVLQTATAFGPQAKLDVADASPGHVTLSAGSEWVAGKKNMRVAAWPVEGGVNVQVEAWWEGVPWGEMNADPRPFAGRLVRKDLWKTTARLLALLGIPNPEPVVRHY